MSKSGQGTGVNYTTTSSGTNEQVTPLEQLFHNYKTRSLTARYLTSNQGNHYCHRDHSSSGSAPANSNSYHYSNENGSYYYSNPNGSTYYNDGKGGSTYDATGAKK